jgi:arylsulfatase B
MAIASSLALGACGGGSSGSGGSSSPIPGAGNVLVIVLDDMGVDKIGAYAEHPAPAVTETLDRLASEGLLYRDAYAQPWCSPTRACLLTGRYGFRTGIGNPVNQPSPDAELPLEEITIPELLDLGSSVPVDTAFIGKWHLTSTALGNLSHPNAQGFGWFEGVMGNFGGDGYFLHPKVTNGLMASSVEYATTEQVDDAARRIESMSEPWLLHLSFNAAHQPFHAPPAYLHGQVLSGDPFDSPAEHVAAMIEACDREIGRLLDGIDPEVLARTTVIVVGDNGTDPDAMVAPWPISGKGTMLEGGVRVPLIVWGREVGDPGREVTGFVHAVDLFPTIVELFGVDVAAAMPDARPIDGRSFAASIRSAGAAPTRDRIFCDTFWPNGLTGPYSLVRRMIRTERWKLIDQEPGPDQLYDLQGLQHEANDLLLAPLDPEAQAAYDALLLELQQLAAGG